MKANRESGVALIVMLLFISVVLVAILVGTTQLSLGNRRGVANEVAAYRAVLTSESGLNAFNYRQLKYKQLPGGLPLACQDQVDDIAKVKQRACEAALKAKIDGWLASAIVTADASDTLLKQVPLTGGSAALEVLNIDVKAKPIPASTNVDFVLAAVDVQATSTIDGNQGRVVQRFSAAATDLPMPGVGAALTSYPPVKYGGAGDISGIEEDSPTNDGILNSFATGPLTFATSTSTEVTTSTPVKFDISASSKASLPAVNSYIRLPLTTSAGTSAGQGVFRVTENDGGKVTALPVTLPTTTGLRLPTGNVPGDFVINAVSGYASTTPSTLKHVSKEALYPGDAMVVKDPLTGIVLAKGTVASVSSTMQASITWNPSAPVSLPEGAVIVKNVYAVASAYTVTRVGNGGAPVGGEKARSTTLVPSPSNNELFLKTFGMKPRDLKDMSTVVSAAQTMNVSGLTWVDQDNTKETIKLYGSGITVFTGDLTLNTANAAKTGCKYSGLIYVRGNLNIQGNVGICGAIVAEGTVTADDGETVTGINIGDTTQVLGNGQKIAYDIDAIIEATSNLGYYAFTPQAGTWRQR